MTKFIKIIVAFFLLGPHSIAQLQAGELDLNFDPGTGASGNVSGGVYEVLAIAHQPDEKIIIGGTFSQYNGVSCSRLARLNANGSLDTSFNLGTGISGPQNAVWGVSCIVLRPDGKILIGGYFTEYNNIPKNHIALLNSNGSIDSSFNIGVGTDDYVSKIALQPDGKILIVGGFTEYNGIGRNGIARLNSDGSIDTSFDPGSGANSSIRTLVVQSDGKILIGGTFATYDGVVNNNIARLNADGSLDSSFDCGAGTNDWVHTLCLQPDSKILVGGNFTEYDGTSCNHILRLNAGGDVDISFNADTITNSWNNVQAVSLQPDGKILMGGNNPLGSSIFRLNSDGTLDTSFNQGTGTTTSFYFAYICAITVQPDKKILIGGHFTDYNNTARRSIARLRGDSSIIGTTVHISPNLVKLKVFPNPILQSAIIEVGSIENKDDLILELYSINGELLQSFTLENHKGYFQIEKGNLFTGIYILAIKQNGYLVAKAKIAIL